MPTLTDRLPLSADHGVRNAAWKSAVSTPEITYVAEETAPSGLRAHVIMLLTSLREMPFPALALVRTRHKDKTFSNELVH